MTRLSTTPAIADALGVVIFRGRDSLGNQEDYASIQADILNPASGTEYGQLRFLTVAGGVLDTALAIESDISDTETVLIVRNNKLGIMRFDRVVVGADGSGSIAGHRMLQIAN